MKNAVYPYQIVLYEGNGAAELANSERERRFLLEEIQPLRNE